MIAALVMLGIACFSMLFFRGLMDPSEGRYAEAPREMVERGQWLVMRLFDYYYYEKPPLTYWITAPAIMLFGNYDWAVRIPLLINAALIVILLYSMVRKNWSQRQISKSLPATVATVGFIGGMGVLLTDPFLTLWFFITCICLYRGFAPGASHKHRFSFLMAASIAAFLGFITKGAVAVVLPGAIILCWLLWERRVKDLLTPGLPVAAILFLALLAPMLWLIEQHNPGFFYHFIYEEHIARFTGTRAKQGHVEPFWFYAYVIPTFMLPWTFFAVRAGRFIVIKRVLSSKKHHDLPESNDSSARFMTVWVLVVVGFFSISTGKMMSYILPATPIMLLLLARWGIAEPLENSRTDARLWKLGVIGMFITAASVIMFWCFSFFQIFPDDLYRISGITILALIPMLVSLGVVVRKRALMTFHGTFLFGTSILLTVSLILSPLSGRNFNAKSLKNSSAVYKEIAGIIEPEDRIVVLWDYRPSLPFYCGTDTILFQHQNELAYGMALEPEREGRHIDTIEELREIVETCPGRVFAVIEPRHMESLFLPLGFRHVPAPIAGNRDTKVLQLLPSEY